MKGWFTFNATKLVPVNLEEQVQPRLRELKFASSAQLVSDKSQKVVKRLRVAVGSKRANLNVDL